MTEVSQMPTTMAEPSANTFQFEDRPNSLSPSSNLRPTGIRPMMNPNNPNTLPVRPIRMQQPQPTERRNISDQQNHQQYQLQSGLNQSQNQQIYLQQQQNYMVQNHPQQHPQQLQNNTNRNNMQQKPNTILQNHPQQQQNYYEKPGVLSREDSAKFQFNTTNKTNVSDQYNQGGGIFSENQRTSAAPHMQFSESRQPIKPHPSNNNNYIPTNHTQPMNHRKVENPKIPGDQIQSNYQNDNFKNQFSKEYNMKPSSDIDANSTSKTNAQTKLNETTHKPQIERKPTGPPNTPVPDINREPDSINVESALSSELKSKPNGDNAIISKEEDKNMLKSGLPAVENSRKNVKKNAQKENKTVEKDESIVKGLVRKNIQFFEDHDTAKKPLIPVTITAKKRERVENVRHDVVRRDFVKDESESGVDETPMVFPSLRTIFQVPRKVAKISRRVANKHLKSKSRFSSKSLKSSLHKSTGEKPPKIRSYGSNEELLAFFDNSKSWRKLRPYEKTGSGKNETKVKTVYKPTTNGDFTPKKTPSKLPAPSKVNPPISPTKSPLKSPGTPGAKSMPKTPESTAPPTPLIKKVPMNKIQVGSAPSPNLKVVKSKVGSLANTTHKPGGGNVKIETHKIDLTKAQPKIEAKNDQYKPSGGDKKIAQVKLQWSAKSKVGSLENATYKPGGGDKKIESVKLDFKEKAKSKVGSKDNVKHVPGGGNVKIENQKLEFKAQSKVGSLDNVKHKPGGGDIKIFDDKTYLRQVSGSCSEGRASGTQSYRDFIATREVEGRSAPGTPGRKTSVKIKKLISLKSFEETPKVEKITEVIVTSKTKKDEIKVRESPIKQQVKLTYSKVTTPKNYDNENSVEIIKVPASKHAPVLRPSLSNKDAFDDLEAEKQDFGNKNSYQVRNSVSATNEQNRAMQKPSSASPGLPGSKSNWGDDSGISKVLQNEVVKQEKLGETLKEISKADNKTTLPNNRWREEHPKDPSQTFLLEKENSGKNNLQFKLPDSEIQFAHYP